MNFDRVTKLINILTEEISASNKNLLTRFPMRKYINYLDDYPQIYSYDQVSLEIENYCNNIVKNSNEQVLESYHKLILLTLILKAKDKLESKKLSEDVKTLYGTNFERIVKNIESNAYPPGFYKYPQDKFCKDLSICSLRMIPTGARKIQLASISKRFLFKKGLRQLIRGIIFVLFELRGLKPLYDMHTDSHDPDLMAEFSFEGFIRAYKRIAEILKMNDGIKGVFACSWFYDPQLEKISPRLIYLREIITKNGGKAFYIGHSAQANKDATLKSPTRRRLYKEGKYIPTVYMVVWPRKKLIKWASSE